MDVLDSPIDALVFDYLNLGISSIINSLWTWVAVITAAVSFWRIRAAGAGHGAVKTLEEPSPSSAYIGRNNTEPSQPETATSSSTTTATLKSVTEPAVPGSVRKLVVYFYQDDDRQNDGNIDDGGEEELTVFGECGGELTLWERMLRVRMGDYGWYRCQDLTVINGNVVRLWDGERNSSSCVAW
ncbi:Transmembrane protein [Salix suchowensis]|nr:Transmembrane protein [Salix suchowensis]